jgi:hypothetical protein
MPTGLVHVAADKPPPTVPVIEQENGAIAQKAML